MELEEFCRKLPKVELHAHLNGSLSHSTMLQLKRYHADSGLTDNTDAFFDEFQIAAGDTRNLKQCFQVFRIAHSLTTTPKALTLATHLTLQEFQDDGCCYIELRSTPRDTPHMTKKQYIEAIILAMLHTPANMTIISRLIVSIDRRFNFAEAQEITDLVIEFHKLYSSVVVGIEISGDPSVGKFQTFVPLLENAKNAGLKVTLHCGEVCNPDEVQEMLDFNPNRIGHGTCILPRLGGNDSTWNTLCIKKTPVEVCLTSNVNTKSIANYESHHFKELFDAGIPIIICTDDKGVFATSLSQEYRLCAETFKLDNSQLAQLSHRACLYIFDETSRKTVLDKLEHFITHNDLHLQ
ncbi:unnamed protein product [Plutella xylostella]|uniref:(diamondback moth) hypothetical protein n=1 Tax=Plutella xylostella TaxID=51655 RepID=A0A8S4G0Z2_PLUXY|nr:unnamed protein product [Plutella xylostella]